MQPINMIICYWDKKLKKKIARPGSWYNNNFKKHWFDSKDAFFTGRVSNDRHYACLSNKALLIGCIYFVTPCTITLGQSGLVSNSNKVVSLHSPEPEPHYWKQFNVTSRTYF